MFMYAKVNSNLEQNMYYNIYQALHKYFCKNISVEKTLSLQRLLLKWITSKLLLFLIGIHSMQG